MYCVDVKDNSSDFKIPGLLFTYFLTLFRTKHIETLKFNEMQISGPVFYSFSNAVAICTALFPRLAFAIRTRVKRMH